MCSLDSQIHRTRVGCRPGLKKLMPTYLPIPAQSVSGPTKFLKYPTYWYRIYSYNMRIVKGVPPRSLPRVCNPVQSAISHGGPFLPHGRSPMVNALPKYHNSAGTNHIAMEIEARRTSPFTWFPLTGSPMVFC